MPAVGEAFRGGSEGYEDGDKQRKSLQLQPEKEQQHRNNSTPAKAVKQQAQGGFLERVLVCIKHTM